jgi:hypothetical protein
MKIFGIALVVVVSGPLTACAPGNTVTVAEFPGAQATADTWKAIENCDRASRENAVKASCDEKFRGTAIAGRFHHLAKGWGGNDLMYVDFSQGSLNRFFSCVIDDATFHDRLARLSKGDVVRIKGDLKGGTQVIGGDDTVLSAGSTVRMSGVTGVLISLESCTLAD